MDINDYLKSLSQGIKIKEVSGSRTVKTSAGEHQVSYLAEVGEMSLLDAKVAGYLLAMQLEQAVYEHAFASGSISKEFFQDMSASIKSNYSELIQRFLVCK